MTGPTESVWLSARLEETQDHYQQHILPKVMECLENMSESQRWGKPIRWAAGADDEKYKTPV